MKLNKKPDWNNQANKYSVNNNLPEKTLPQVVEILSIKNLEKMENSVESIETGKGILPTISSDVKNDPVGYKRYLGLVFTLLSTNCSALISTLFKKYSHVHQFNFFSWAYLVAFLLSMPLISYAVKGQNNSTIKSFWPVWKNKKVVFLIWFRAVLSSITYYLVMTTFKYISVADGRIIIGASVITINFFGWLCLGEPCGVVPIIVAIIALCGIGVISRPPILTGADAFDHNTLIGVSLAMTCLLLLTMIIVILRYLQNVHHSIVNGFLYTWAFGQSIILGLAFNKLEWPTWGMDTVGMLSVGVLMTFGNMLLVLALQVEQAGVVALLRTSEVIFTFFWQFLMIGVKPDGISVLGAALVLTGVIVVTIRKWVASLPPVNRTRQQLAFLLK